METGSGKDLRERVYAGERISEGDALELYSWDLIELGMAADFRMRMKTPGGRVGFIIDRIINFTNICSAACSFCAFHAHAGRIEPYELDLDQIMKKVEELAAAGGSQVMLQGGLHPEYTLDTYTAMVKAVKERFPDIYLHSFSPAELYHMAHRGGISLDKVIGTLKDAGLDSVPGASDMLVDRVRSIISPKKLTSSQWCEVMHCLSRHSLKSSATMTYGVGETLRERVSHLGTVRDIQDSTGILRAFIPWSFSPSCTAMEDMPPATGVDYLKTVALSRIFLDNISYIQAGWLTEGLKLAQVALTMGANDMGGVLTEEVVVGATGIRTVSSMDEFIDIIKDAGMIPVLRDSTYREIRTFA